VHAVSNEYDRATRLQPVVDGSVEPLPDASRTTSARASRIEPYGSSIRYSSARLPMIAEPTDAEM
jgi:hypothetical protein